MKTFKTVFMQISGWDERKVIKKLISNGILKTLKLAVRSSTSERRKNNLFLKFIIFSELIIASIM